MKDNFVFEKESRGFLIVTSYFDGLDIDASRQQTREDVLMVDNMLEDVNQLHALLFEYVESFGIPPVKTTFYTENCWNTIIDITIGDHTRPQGGKSINFCIFSEG